jgi:hypothetical protein
MDTANKSRIAERVVLAGLAAESNKECREAGLSYRQTRIRYREGEGTWAD